MRFGRRANNPYLIKAGFGDTEQPNPQLGNKALRLVSASRGYVHYTSITLMGDPSS